MHTFYKLKLCGPPQMAPITLGTTLSVTPGGCRWPLLPMALSMVFSVHLATGAACTGCRATGWGGWARECGGPPLVDAAKPTNKQQQAIADSQQANKPAQIRPVQQRANKQTDRQASKQTNQSSKYKYKLIHLFMSAHSLVTTHNAPQEYS